MKRWSFFCLVCCMILVAGCANKIANNTTPSKTTNQDSTMPYESIEPSPTETLAEQTFPSSDATSVPTITEPGFSSDDYFATIDPVPIKKDGKTWWYDSTYVNGEVYVENGKVLYVKEPSGDTTPIMSDNTGKMNLFDCCVNGCYFFTANVNDNHDGIYRLYLPEKRIDLLYDKLPTNSQAYAITNVLSNWEVVFRNTEEFQTVCEEQWTKETVIGGIVVIPKEYFHSDAEFYQDARLKGEAWREYRNAIDMEFFYPKGKYSVTEIYFNGLTGETRNIYSWMSDLHNEEFVYPDGSYREVSCEYKSDYFW